MRKRPATSIERYRVTTGFFGTPRGSRNGKFECPGGIVVIASDGEAWKQYGLPGDPWEHVSVSLRDRCPTWEELDAIKDQFWDSSETVIQLHVPKDVHVNCHPFCLHLWKPPYDVQLPPALAVGPLTKAE